MHRDGELRHGYWINPSPRQITEFSGVIADSFSRHATFMNALLIVRFHRAGSVSLHNLQLRESNGPVTRTHAIPGPDALPAVIEQCFGIDSQLARRALAGIDLSRNVFA
jgi:arylamine N-acetyltransferase